MKQYSRDQFLRDNPWCCYCGATATTTDHCPPRALFWDRKWPEGYEFPACKPCNDEARPDEQLIAVLAKVWAWKHHTKTEEEYWRRQLQGLKNNQPDIMMEMLADSSRNAQRSALRRIYGDKGDDLRRLGYGVAHIGPKVRAAIDRFTIKLGKALFYKHTRKLLDGEIWHSHLSMAARPDSKKVVGILTSIAPFQSAASRSGEEMHEQFIYHFNYTDGPEPILYAVIQFSDQMMFSVLAVSKEFVQAVGGSINLPGGGNLPLQRVAAKLRNPSR